MLVYGERVRSEDPHEALETLRALAREQRAAAPPRRRELATSAFLVAAELLQGLADERFERLGEDAVSPLLDWAMHLARRTAGPMLCDAPCSEHSVLPAPEPLPARIPVRTPEGYAFYAVHPEAYAKAARALRGAGPWRVIGLRSIGAGLAAAVAAALRASDAVSLRPAGHPFRRELRIAPALAERLLAPPAPRFAIVDEGPGLSGSSFGAVADFLEAAGVAPERIVFLPSHGGDPGPAASPRHRRRWSAAERHPAELEQLLRDEPIETWFADLVGAALRPAQDLSAGAWLGLRRGEAGASPPIFAGQERRKWLIAAEHGRFLARFAGLGRVGEEKLGRARAPAGFCAAPLALRRGFLLEPWLEETRALRLTPATRARFVAHLGAYLAFRAARFPSADGEGASWLELTRMALVNVGEALGDAAAARCAARLRPVQAAGRRVSIDGRLHAWEWLTLADGRWLKTDALDHDGAHDLVGRQPIEWDLAGASLEFELSASEAGRLAAAVEAAAGRVDRSALPAWRLAYGAFQLGLWTLAAQSQTGEDAAGAATAAARYRTLIAAALA